MSSTPDPPKGTKIGGRRLWRSVVAEYDLEEHELALLREMTRTVDTLDALAVAVELGGAVGEHRVHPAVVEARQQRIALARLAASLRLPAGDGDAGAQGLRRPQRRGAARGTYRLGVVVQ